MKIHIEELIRKIEAAKPEGPKINADKIINKGNKIIQIRESNKKSREGSRGENDDKKYTVYP